MRYTLFQFHLSQEASNHLNSVGWGGELDPYPEIVIQRDVKFSGSEYYSAWMSKYYRPVADINAESLEDAFRVGNIGPEANIRRLDRMASMSIGDVVRDNQTGTYHMVDSYGFTQLLSWDAESSHSFVES